MKKKIIILVVVIFILIIAGGIFWWWQKDKIEDYLEQKEFEMVVAPAKDYVVIESSTGKFIENRKDKFKIKVPEEWGVEIGMDMGGYVSDRKITLYSSDFSYRPQRGCLVEMEISRLARQKEGFLIEGAEEVKKIINDYKNLDLKEREKDGIEILLLDQREALKKTELLKGNGGKLINIKIPTESRVYIFYFVQFSEECNQELNKFLETLSIH